MSATRGLVAAGLLARRELGSLVRRPARIAAAVGTSLMLWLLLGAGLAGAVAAPGGGGANYGGFLVPGMAVLVALMASVFTAIGVIEDRQSGWLQAVIVSPAPRWSIAVGEIAGGAAVAWIQAVVLLPAVWLVGVRPGVLDVLIAAGALALAAIAVTALALAFAWRCTTSSGFHAVMNLVLFPLWLLSSAMFPLDGAAGWLAPIMRIDPATWTVEAVRGALLGDAVGGWLALSAAFAVVSVGAAIWSVGRGR